MSDLEKQLKTLRQMLSEISHAQQNGPGWYTRGHDGMFQQVSMWIGRGNDALDALEEALKPVEDDLIERAESLSRALCNLCMDDDAEVIDKLIEALKPVEDAELERMIFHIGDVENYLTADERNHYVSLIERLVREKAEAEERERVLLHNMNAIYQNITWIARLSEPVHPPQEDD